MEPSTVTTRHFGSSPALSGLTGELIHPSCLSERDMLAWQSLRQTHRAYQSPLFSPEFAMAVGRCRRDAEVALLRERENNVLVGVFPFHRRPGRFARGLGAPFCDYEGPVWAPGRDVVPRAVLQLSRLAAFRFSNLVDPERHFATAVSRESEAGIICLDRQTPAQTLEAQRALYPKRFKNMRRLARQIETKGATLSLDWGPPNRREFGQLLAWKSAQFRQNGLLDVTRDPLLAQMAEEKGSVCGFMIQLRLGGQPIAGQFGVREGALFHPWIAAFDPAFKAFSPGLLLLKRMVEEMPAIGLTRIDLCDGSEHFKKYFTNDHIPIYRGFARGAGLDSRAQAIGEAVWHLVGAADSDGLTGRLKRRLDHIAASERGMSGRIKEVGRAFASRSLHVAK